MQALLAALGGVAGFFKALPALLNIYFSIKRALGDNSDKFFADVDKASKLIERSLDPNLSFDEKRNLRREALEASKNLWGRIDDGV